MKVIITETTGYDGEGIIGVTKNGYKKTAIECSDITILAKR